MNDNGVGGHVFDREALHRRTDQHQALRRHFMRDSRLDVGTEGESCKHGRCRRDRREFVLGESQRRKCVSGLADSVVESSFAVACAAKVESYAGVAQCNEGLGKRLRDLVVQRPALQRMRMRDQRDSARCSVGYVQCNFERACGAGDPRTQFAARQIFNLSTTRPCTTCESMISSMSWRSTYVYQTSSG